QDPQACFSPARRFPELRQERAEIKKSERLAGQMCVRAEVSRQICFEVSRVQIQKLANSQECFGRERYRVFEKIERPQPRYRSERDLEAAGPIHAELRWVLVHPRIDVGDEGFGVMLVICQPVSLAQGHEILVAVEFPNNFLVA